MRKLNGWERLGVVLSGAWFLFVALVLLLLHPSPYAGLTDDTLFYHVTRPQSVVVVVPGVKGHCTQADPNPPDKESILFTVGLWHQDADGTLCLDKHYRGEVAGKTRTIPEKFGLSWKPALVLAFAPVLGLWVLFYLLTGCGKWIVEGFKNSKK